MANLAKRRRAIVLVSAAVALVGSSGVVSASARGATAPAATVPTTTSANDVTGSTFHPVAPVRVLDTRYGTGAPRAAVQPHRTLTMQMPGLVDSDATAVVINVTVTQPAATGHLTVFPGGTTLPNASNLNFATGETVANLVTAKLGSGRMVAFYNSSASTVHVLADLAGYFAGDTSGDRFIPTQPTRALDTRTGVGAPEGPVAARQTITVAMPTEIVPTDARAVVFNLTVTRPTTGGHLTVFPAGATVPNTSNVNFPAAKTVPNLVTVELGSGRTVAIANASNGTVQLIADVLGYYTLSDGGQRFHPSAPVRVLDTRATRKPGSVKAHRTLTISLPEGVVPEGTGAVALNVTVTGPTAAGVLKVYAGGAQRPMTSNVNFVAGETVPNLVVTMLGSARTVSFFNDSDGEIQLIADVAGSWARFYSAPMPFPPDFKGDVDQYPGQCTGPGSCVFVGDYYTTGGVREGMLLTLKHNVWSAHDAPRPLPANAKPSALARAADISAALACDRAGPCYGASSYEATDGTQRLLIETLDNGTWSTMEAPYPSDAAAPPPPPVTLPDVVPDLKAVACAEPGTCYAVGDYINTDGDQVGLIETLSHGTWTATAAPVGIKRLNHISCAPTHTCVAIDDALAEGNTQTLDAVVLRDGTVTRADIPEPATNNGVHLEAVSCPAAGSCHALGWIYTSSGLRGFDAAYADGTWTSSLLPLPPDLPVFGAPFYDISCASATSCAAVGNQAINSQTYADVQTLETLVGSTWSAAWGRLPVPATIPSMEAVTCARVSLCVGVGSYYEGAFLQPAYQIWDGKRWVETSGGYPRRADRTVFEFMPFVCDGLRCYALAEYGVAYNNKQMLIETFVE